MNSTTKGQIDNKESRFRDTRTILYTLVSYGTGHSFRGTSIERERLLELCFGLNVQRENERIRGRPKVDVKPSGTKWIFRTVQLSMRGRDEDMSRQNRKERDQIFTTETPILSVFLERMISLRNSEPRRLPFC